MLSRSVFRAVRITSRCRWYSGSSEFDNLVSDALKKANISDSDDVAKLQKNNISSLDTLRSMSPDDFNQIGVTVGSRIAIQQALNGTLFFLALDKYKSSGYLRRSQEHFFC